MPIDQQDQDDSFETGGVLDSLYAEVSLDPNAPKDDKPKDDVTPPDDGLPAEQSVGDEPKDDKPKEGSDDEGLPAEQPAGDEPVKPASRIPGTDTKPPAGEEAPVVTDDPVLKFIEELKLRDSASTKSKDTFENLKRLSAEAVKAEKAAAAKLKADYDAKLAEADKKLANAAAAKLPEDIEKELAELRGFKATFDIENDPEFKKQIEAKVEPRKAANYESVYGVLKSHGLPESELKVLREMSEADRIAAIGDLVEKLPRGPSRMKVEAKLMDNLNLDDERERAIADAREKAAKTKQEFRVAPEKQREQTLAEVKAAAEQHRANAIFKKAEIAATTPPEEKKKLEAHNAEVEKYSKLYDEVLADDSPAARAEAAFGLVLAHHFKAQFDAVNDAKTKLENELAAIKKRGGLGTVGKLTNTPASSRPTEISTFDAGDSLDALARQAGIL